MLVCFFSGKSQPYLDSTAIWKEFAGFSIMAYYHHMHYDIYFSGDTILGSLKYYKCKKTGTDSVFYNNIFQYVGLIGDSSFAIREDTNTKKYYCRFYSQNIDDLLYDFNLNLGDTIPSNMYGIKGCFSQPVILTCLDTVVLGNQPKRRFFIGNTKYFFIEGIGSNTGLLGMLCGMMESGSCLEVFYKNSDSLVVNGCFASNPCIITNASADNANFKLQIFPNPFTTSATLSILNTPASNLKFELLDIFGRQVKQFAIKNPQTEITRDNLPSGIYFYRVSSADGIIGAGKVVVE